MILTPMIRKQVQELCDPVARIEVSYADLTDRQLAQLSTYYVALHEGFKCYPELYSEIQRLLSGQAEDPFAAIYAELVRRITEATDKGSCKPDLVHTLYRQAICASQGSYGDYSEEEPVETMVLYAIGRLQADGHKQTDYAAYHLMIDTYHIFGDFEPEDKETLEATVDKWNAELEAGNWNEWPAGEVVQRIFILTAYYDLYHTDLTTPAPQSVSLLERLSDRVIIEADMDALIIYREALRNVYCYQTVSTPYFTRLEQTAQPQPDGIASVILQGLLRIDRLERELAD